jgi:hypothetical protein
MITATSVSFSFSRFWNKRLIEVLEFKQWGKKNLKLRTRSPVLGLLWSLNLTQLVPVITETLFFNLQLIKCYYIKWHKLFVGSSTSSDTHLAVIGELLQTKGQLLYLRGKLVDLSDLEVTWLLLLRSLNFQNRSQLLI